MSRRHLAYTVLFVASVVVSACSSATAPRNETYTCWNGSIIILGSGAVCDPQ